MQPLLVTIVVASALLMTVNSVPHPRAMAGPMAVAGPVPAPNCCGAGQGGCGLGLCSCCGDTTCENGACNPIIKYVDGFYGAPRCQGGYGSTFAYGR